ncbi:MAG: hypothetical protein KDA84_19355 [Planctomycetaceae bacterium]|nr:hypothetical protein [Planctomycetaceae bacterium]
MVEPVVKAQMFVGGAGGLGLAIGKGIGENLGGNVGAWLGLGLGFAAGGFLAWLIVRLTKPNLISHYSPWGWVGTGVLIGVVPATICYFFGDTGGSIAFWSMVGIPLVIGLGMAVVRKSRKEVSNE